MTALQTYRDIVQAQPPLTEEWFAETLAEFRAGSEPAFRRLTASCLRRALELVEQHSADPDDILARVQDANAVLVQAVQHFSGDSLEEFLPQLEANLLTHLQGKQ